MQDQSDAQLLREFAERADEAAFRELVTRHMDFVYSAALRQVESSAIASDLAQSVFTDLARKAQPLAEKITGDSSLAGWLHRSTRYAALNHLRDRRRRRENERQAMEQLLTNSDSAADWEQIRPALDEALDSLAEEDREALLLRYFKNHDFRAVGHALGVSDDTAQKRVSRAVERLREFFANRDVTVGAGGLVVVISANAVQAAPVGLAITISAAALAGTAVSISTVIATTKTIAMTTLQKTIITASFVAAAGAGIFEARQAAQLREQNQTLQQTQAPLVADLTKLRAENERLSNLVAEAKEQKKLSQSQFNELLKLRGQTGQAQTAVQELAKVRAAVKQQNSTMPAFMTNAMATGMAMADKFKKKAVASKVTRMKEMLHLTDEQAQAVSDVMLKHIDENSKKLLQAMSQGQLNGVQLVAPNSISEEDEIKSLLNAEQLSGYDTFTQAEALAGANNSAKAQVERMTDELKLSLEQQDQIRPLLVQNTLDTKSASDKKALSKALTGGNFSTVLDLQMQAQQQNLERELKMFEGVLTPEQIQKYKQSELDKFEMGNNALKMFMPQTNSPATQ